MIDQTRGLAASTCKHCMGSYSATAGTLGPLPYITCHDGLRSNTAAGSPLFITRSYMVTCGWLRHSHTVTSSMQPSDAWHVVAHDSTLATSNKLLQRRCRL